MHAAERTEENESTRKYKTKACHGMRLNEKERDLDGYAFRREGGWEVRSGVGD